MTDLASFVNFLYSPENTLIVPNGKLVEELDDLAKKGEWELANNGSTTYIGLVKCPIRNKTTYEVWGYVTTRMNYLELTSNGVRFEPKI